MKQSALKRGNVLVFGLSFHKKRFQWDEGGKIENPIYCLSNFKIQMEYKKSRRG